MFFRFSILMSFMGCLQEEHSASLQHHHPVITERIDFLQAIPQLN